MKIASILATILLTSNYLSAGEWTTDIDQFLKNLRTIYPEERFYSTSGGSSQSGRKLPLHSVYFMDKEVASLIKSEQLDSALNEAKP
jgi:hypothetical protein